MRMFEETFKRNHGPVANDNHNAQNITGARLTLQY